MSASIATPTRPMAVLPAHHPPPLGCMKRVNAYPIIITIHIADHGGYHHSFVPGHLFLIPRFIAGTNFLIGKNSTIHPLHARRPRYRYEQGRCIPMKAINISLIHVGRYCAGGPGLGFNLALTLWPTQDGWPVRPLWTDFSYSTGPKGHFKSYPSGWFQGEILHQ